MDIVIKQVMAAEEKLADAHVRMDIELIDRLLHPEYVIIQSGGIVETKNQVLDSYRSGLRYWEFAQSDQMDIRVYEETAIVIGRWQAKGQNRGVDFNYVARFLSVWIRQTGRWRNLTSQSTEIS